MKTYTLILSLLVLLACKKKETKQPDPAPTTTGTVTPVKKDTIQVVLTGSQPYNKLIINWDYSAIGTQVDSIYTYGFGPNTQTKFITSDSISVDYLCASSSTATIGIATLIIINKNGTQLINYPAAIGRKYIKIK